MTKLNTRNQEIILRSGKFHPGFESYLRGGPGAQELLCGRGHEFNRDLIRYIELIAF